MEKPNLRIESIDLRVLYIRHQGTYQSFRKESRKMFKLLFAYGEKFGLIDETFTKVLTIYDDNPYITVGDQLRTSVAMSILNDIAIIEEGDITEKTISGHFAILEFNISAKEYGEAWEYVYNDWAKKSEYTLRDAVPFELYVEEPAWNMNDKTRVDFYIPIQ